MEKEIEELIQKNEVLKQISQQPKEELEIVRFYLNLRLVKQIEDKEKNQIRMKFIKTCSNESYNYLDAIALYRNQVDVNSITTEEPLDRIKRYRLCDNCCSQNCIKKTIAIFMEEMEKENKERQNKLNELEVIDFFLKRESLEVKEVPKEEFFDEVDLMDLIYVQILLESDWVRLTSYDPKQQIAEFEYLDLTKKKNQEYYINKFIHYYQGKEEGNHLTLELEDLEAIFKEKDRFLRVYKIAAYYQYLRVEKKIDCLTALRKMLAPENTQRGMKIRSHYFKYQFFNKVEELPYSKKTKERIYCILNYILNYRYKEGTPYIPINILIYSNDKEGVEKIVKIIGEFMWFFGYLAENMRYYSESINNVILDKFFIKKLYYENDKRKNGILLLHNFENLLYMEHMQQNLNLNLLTDEMEKNNANVCTIIYGEKKVVKQIIENYHKLSKVLINLELEIEHLEIEQIEKLLIEKLEKSMEVPEEVKERIHNYIQATYKQSDNKNMEYVNHLYQSIILAMNNTFTMKKKPELKVQDIPEAYNTKDLPTIMKEINSLVGLTEIKEQINDLVALLKFNEKANLDIKDFNLHMVFSGNPGTGKTTVARLITDIFFQLGYCNQNKLTEVTAKDLIAEYLGQTSGKTFNVVKSALGGVLFIDEAYAITSGIRGGTQYGNECVATLLKLMEDYKDRLIIIFAGYQAEMEKFQNTNPGLVSRIGYKINFPDYKLEELMQIYLNLLEKNKLKITEEALQKVQRIIKESSSIEDFGNARYIHHIFQKVLIEHAKNIEYNHKEANLYLIAEEDINYEKLIAKKKRRSIGF